MVVNLFGYCFEIVKKIELYTERNNVKLTDEYSVILSSKTYVFEDK